ncbi:MAG: glycosyltransferase family 4 protein [Bryobacterales bacterium]|nr:glycosyltransferase family 4 protein [Bryobacterales bacterium]
MTRILHIVGDSKFGGASFGILRLARRWRSAGWEAVVLATDPEFLRRAEELQVPVLDRSVVWREIRPLRDLLGLIRLVWILRRGRYSIVHTHTTKAGFVGRIAAWMANVPIVLHTVHGFAFHEASPPAKVNFYRWMERFAALFCRKIITVSHFHREWAERLGIADDSKLIAIPNGIPEPAIVTAQRIREIRSAWNVGPAEVAIFTGGRLAPEKGIEDLVDAIALLPESSRPKLVLAGDGELRPQLEARAASRGVRDRVMFLGFQKNVSELLEAADLVVLPTWREGLSISLLEAMAQSRPIITTNIGPNLEATDNGRVASLVPPGRADMLAKAIAELAGDAKKRKDLGRAARQRYLENYTQSQMLDAYYGVYTQLLKEVICAQPVLAVLPSHDR